MAAGPIEQPHERDVSAECPPARGRDGLDRLALDPTRGQGRGGGRDLLEGLQTDAEGFDRSEWHGLGARDHLRSIALPGSLSRLSPVGIGDNAAVSQPASRPRASEAPPAPDPIAVERAYRRHQVRRQIRSARLRERRNAQIRFFVVIALLLGLSLAFGLTAWHEIQRLFGL